MLEITTTLTKRAYKKNTDLCLCNVNGLRVKPQAENAEENFGTCKFNISSILVSGNKKEGRLLRLLLNITYLKRVPFKGQTDSVYSAADRAFERMKLTIQNLNTKSVNCH
ncbi:hypothetical protein [Oceanobacillus massiliensis]|uniref:hypothetical protein n=1 Tax=Oceanobacillus massiliensis TaxID=1465765 RepID=UPI0011CA8562|nr:hypothetical protein [Oceanobacillus massiliensis]